MSRKPSMQTLRVLTLMLEKPDEQHYGLELAKKAKLLTGTIYPILMRLEQDQWLESGWEDIDPVKEGRRPRRYYRLTPLGERRATEALNEARAGLGWVTPIPANGSV